jgi:hypothetical protein
VLGDRKVVLVTRHSRIEELLARFHTLDQARCALGCTLSAIRRARAIPECRDQDIARVWLHGYQNADEDTVADADNGVIFSDGIESDFLAFNSGIVATISVSERVGHLIQ